MPEYVVPDGMTPDKLRLIARYLQTYTTIAAAALEMADIEVPLLEDCASDVVTQLHAWAFALDGPNTHTASVDLVLTRGLAPEVW